MHRHQHMVDLLRPTLIYDEQLDLLLRKHELTLEDLNVIIEKSEMIKKTAEIARMQRYNK